MGLDATLSYKGLYHYADRYGEIVYRELKGSQYNQAPHAGHSTDFMETPLIGIFARGPDQEEFVYAGYVSTL